MKSTAKQKLISAILALLLTASALASCGQDTTVDPVPADTSAADSTAEETTAETLPPELTDDLPTDKKFEEEDFTILSMLFAEGSTWYIQDIYTEDMNGERINDAVYNRNQKMNERFGVVVKQDLVNNASAEAQTRIMAGDGKSFDVLSERFNQYGTLITGGHLIPLNNVDYLNFDKAWWDGDSIDTLKYADRIYCAAGWAELNNYKGTWVTLFNKKVVQDAGLPVDIYQVVRDGDWTLDKLKEYGKIITKDVDGDGVITPGTDILGISTEFGAVSCYFHASGQNLVDFAKDGSYEYKAGSDGVVNAMETIWNFMNTDNTSLYIIDLFPNSTRWADFRGFFAEDKTGFYPTNLGAVTLISGNMQSDFGILPIPKTDKSVDKYYSDVQIGNVYAMSLPKTSPNPDQTGMLLEGYEMLSYDTVRPAYYDYTLTRRSMRDVDSEEMMNIIFANRNLDMAMIYDSATGLNTFAINTVKNRDAFTYVSNVSANKEAHITKLNTLMEAFKKAES